MKKQVKEKSAAVLTIFAPGKMTPKGRKDVAEWLRLSAKNLVKYGDKFDTTRFTARYLYR